MVFFMTLGRYLAEGKWLGPYDQLTLVKGPGYPAFLALAQWLGLPVSLAHALLRCFAIAIFVIVLHRFIGSFLLSGLLFRHAFGEQYQVALPTQNGRRIYIKTPAAINGRNNFFKLRACH